MSALDGKTAARLASWPGLAYFPSVRRLVETGRAPVFEAQAAAKDAAAWVDHGKRYSAPVPCGLSLEWAARSLHRARYFADLAPAYRTVRALDPEPGEAPE